MGILGQGTEGIVYKAKNRLTGEKVAIKQIKLNLSSCSCVKRLIRQISILRQLNCGLGKKYITALREVIAPEIDEAEPYKKVMIFLVLEFVKGESLAKFMDRIQFSNEKISEDNIMQLCHSLVSAVNYIHGANVLHRDLKPDNILVQDDFTVKICDFGLSRVCSEVPEYSGPAPSTKE